MPFNLVCYSQNDPQWKADKLGFGSQDSDTTATWQGRQVVVRANDEWRARVYSGGICENAVTDSRVIDG